MKTDRTEVYTVLDGERAYQDSRWGGQVHDRGHSIEDWLVYMEDYISEAKHICSREAADTCYPKALGIIRKVAAMGIACMENHGAPKREGF